MTEPHIARTASTLLRRYGDRARTEALVWRRHFAETGESRERRVWARIAWAVRAAAREGEAASATG